MILVRTTFQVKFGHMNAMLAIVKEAIDANADIGGLQRVLTDASGQMFTLVFETTAESIDAHGRRLMESYGDPAALAFMKRTEPHIEHGRREYFTIEWTASGA